MLVLVHGFMQDATTWDTVSELLAREGIDGFAPNLQPGAEGAASLDNLAAVLHEQIARRLAEAAQGEGGKAVVEKILLVGYSLGGRVALAYTRKFTDSVGHLVLESANLGPKSLEDRAAFAQRNAQLATRIASAATMEGVVSYWEQLPLFETQRELPEDVRAQQRAMRLACDRQQLARITEDAGVYTMPDAADTLDFLESAAIPLLYIAGSKDASRAEDARLIAERNVAIMSTCTLACGHNAHLECPEDFAHQIAQCYAQAGGM